MRTIKVLGPGCKNSKITANLIRIVAEQARIETELEKVTDIAKIMSYGVISTPGVVVEGELVHADEQPSPDQVRGRVTE